MAKKMNKGYKGYFYKDDGTEEVMGTMVSASLVSLILTVFIPPAGVVLDFITIPVTIGTGVVMGTNLAINRYHSRKLFEAIGNGDVSGIEERLNRISKKFDGNKKYIFNGVMDKNGNTLIASIIKLNINEETKIKLIGEMINNGANVCKENTDGKIPIEIAEENGVGSELLEFLAEKTKDKLDSREAKYNPITERYSKKLENNRKKIENIEAEINKRKKEIEGGGFHPFKRMAIKSLERDLEGLKKEKGKIEKAKDKMNSKMKEKVTDKREILNGILNLNKNEEFIDGQIQIE